MKRKLNQRLTVKAEKKKPKNTLNRKFPIGGAANGIPKNASAYRSSPIQNFLPTTLPSLVSTAAERKVVLVK